jgi:hypothetical protein
MITLKELENLYSELHILRVHYVKLAEKAKDTDEQYILNNVAHQVDIVRDELDDLIYCIEITPSVGRRPRTTPTS